MTMLAFASPLFADEEVLTRLANQVSNLRITIDDEAQQLSRSRQVDNTQVKALSAELAELEIQTERAQARSASLGELVRARRAELEARRGEQVQGRATLLEVAELIRSHIAQTSPLHRDARLQRVVDLRARVESGVIEPSAGYDELVAITLDELELARTTQLSKHVVGQGDEARLMPVVALGTALIYWRDDEGDHAGMIWRDDEGKWVSTGIDDAEQQRAIEALYLAEKTSARAAVLQLPLMPATRLDEPDEATP